MNSKTEEKILNFFEKFQKKTVEKQQILITPESSPDGVFLLTDGIVRMYQLSKDGLEYSLNIFKPISFFPMDWVINNTENEYYFDALTNATVYIAPKDTFRSFLLDNPDVMLDLLQRIYSGLNGYFLRMESLLQGNAYYRIIIQLVIHSRRFGNHIHLTHTQIAALTGLSRETVTRELQKLLERNIIVHKGRTLVITDIEELEKEL